MADQTDLFAPKRKGGARKPKAAPPPRLGDPVPGMHWRSMTTAPRDGDDVLLAIHGQRSGVPGYWDAEYEWDEEEEDEEGFTIVGPDGEPLTSGAWFAIDATGHFRDFAEPLVPPRREPMAWMPMPELPMGCERGTAWAEREAARTTVAAAAAEDGGGG